MRQLLNDGRRRLKKNVIVGKKQFLPSNNKKEANESMKEKLRALETSKNHF